MAEAKKGFLRKGEELKWQEGNLVCIKKTNGKFRLSVRNPKCIVKNENNKWIFKEEFDYVSKPNQYISIIRKNDNSRLLDLLHGTYITDKIVYIKGRLDENSYLAMDTSTNKEVILNLKKIKLGKY